MIQKTTNSAQEVVENVFFGVWGIILMQKRKKSKALFLHQNSLFKLSKNPLLKLGCFHLYEIKNYWW